MRHRPPRVLVLPLIATMALTACSAAGSTTAPPPTGRSSALPASPAGPSPADPGPTARPADGPPARTATAQAGPTFTVRYDWGVPSDLVTVEHVLDVPLPGDVGIPYLVRVETGDHPAEGYSRITFAFHGAWPGYRFEYVPRVTADATGDPVDLPGNAYLQICFFPAQAHDAAYRPTVERGTRRVGYRTLTSYATAGDYEAQVTYGLGLTVAANSDQTPRIRVGELRRVDGTFVVAVDVRR